MTMNFTKGLHLPLILCAGMLFGACSNNTKDKMETMPADSMATAPVPGGMTDTATTPMPADTMATAGAMTMSDANILAAMGMTDSCEVAEAKVAQGKTKNAEVKKFAAMMITDHTKMMTEGKALAAKLNITPAPPANDNMKAESDMMMAQLKSAPAGASFDSTYISMAVMGHQKALDMLNQAKGQAKSEELRAAIEKAIPVVQHHLQESQSMQTAMMSKGTATADTAKKMKM